MVKLVTIWGMYILTNAVKIDVYTSKLTRTWGVYLSIDSYKHLLFEFEANIDALTFSSMIREAIFDTMDHQAEENSEWDLSKICTAALQSVEQVGI